MNIAHKLMLFILVAISVNPAFGQSKTPSLARFNFWDLSLELLIAPGLSEKLDISPGQRSEIEKLRARKDFDVLLSSAMREINAGRHTGDVRSQALSTMDDLVERELLKILDPKQLQGLRLLQIRRTFPTGYSPFEDDEVKKIFKLSDGDSLRLSDAVPKAKIAYRAQLEKLVQESGNSVLRQLPPESIKMFVEYAGNKYFPDEVVHDGTNFSSIPYKPVPFVLVLPYLRSHAKELKLSKRELDTLATIESKYDPSFEKFENQNSHKKFPDFANDLLKSGDIALKTAVSESALKAAYRARALSQFEADFEAPFTEPALCTYFALAPSQITTLRSIAHDEKNKLRQAISKLNGTTFNNLCNIVGVESSNNLKSFFSNVWELGTWDTEH